MKKFLLLCISMVIFGCSSSRNSSNAKRDIYNDVLNLGHQMIDILNKPNHEELLSHFDKSESTIYLSDGVRVQGYDNIKTIIESLPNTRKKLRVTVEKEQLNVLSENAAVYMVEFNENTYDSNNKIVHRRGVWSAVYKWVDNNYKIVSFHESHVN